MTRTERIKGSGSQLVNWTILKDPLKEPQLKESVRRFSTSGFFFMNQNRWPLCHRYQSTTLAKLVAKFATGVVDTGGPP
jgi:hypothetical protein